VRARKAQGVPEEALICKARFGLPGTLLALILCLFISVTMVVDSFQFEAGRRHFNYKSFVASYLSIPLYLILIVGYKLTIKTKHVAPKEADLWTDKPSCSEGRRD
jgi:amino acid transporter